MPSYAVPALTPEVEQAINVLGANAARLAVLGFISTHPGSLVSEIADGTGLAVGTVKNHLAALVALEVLEADPAPTLPYEERRGRHTRYSTIQANLKEQLHQIGILLGVSEPAGDA